MQDFERIRATGEEGWFGVILGDGLPDPPIPFYGNDAQDAAQVACSEYLDWLEESMGSAAPDALEVNHPLLLKAFKPMRYAPSRIRLRPEMPRLERLLGAAVLEELLEHVDKGSGAAAPRGGTATMAGEGVRDADVKAFHAAAAVLVAAEGWDSVPSGTILKLVAPEPVPGMGLVMLLAREGAPFGLTFWDDEERYADSSAAFEEGGFREPGAAPDWVLSIVPGEALQEADLAIFERLGVEPLNVGGKERFPLLMGTESGGVIVRASAERLRWLSPLLRSIGSMVAGLRDRGDRGERWMPPSGFSIEAGGDKPAFQVEPFGSDASADPRPAPPAPAAAVPPAPLGSLRSQLRSRSQR